MSDRHFEDLLDEVLHEDAQVEPLAGLTERVMRRVSLPPPRPSARTLFLWVSAVGIAICLVMAILMIARSAPPRGVAVAVKSPKSQPLLAVDRSAATGRPLPGRSEAIVGELTRSVLERKLTKHRYRPAEVEELPKRAVFPTSYELPAAIQELAALSTRSDSAVLTVIASDSQGLPPAALNIAPLTIAAIEIKPLFAAVDLGNEKTQKTKENP